MASGTTSATESRGTKRKDPEIAEELQCQEKLDKVDVTIIGATGLKHLNRFTGDNPWCSCVVKQDPSKEKHPAKFSTEPVVNTLEPIWNKQHMLDWKEGEDLEFTIEDKGLFGSKSEGTVVVKSEHFQRNGLCQKIKIDGLENAFLHVRITPLRIKIQREAANIDMTALCNRFDVQKQKEDGFQENMDFSDKKCGDNEATTIASFLKTNTTLQKIFLKTNVIGEAGATDIAKSLESNTTLQELFLDHNRIANEGAYQLGFTLRTNTTLRWLSLGQNQIGDIGAKGIGEGLKTNTSVETLRLVCNQIGDDGAKAIGEGMKTNASLVWLWLDYNRIGDDGAKAIGESTMFNDKLVSVSLDGNNKISKDCKSELEHSKIGKKIHWHITLMLTID